MTEYKLLKDFGELVPGMIFENDRGGSNLTIINYYSNKVIEFTFDSEPAKKQYDSVLSFEYKYKLIYDPRKKNEMSECKLLKDFGELVPGMIFENDSGEVFTIYEIFNKNIVTLKWARYSCPTTCNIDCDMVVRLTHDPRKKNEMTTQEKIDEHKHQIEILEKELEKETLKNVFVKHQYYKIKTKNDTFICKFDMSDSDNKFIWVEFVDRVTRKFSTDDIQKVWHIENLEDVFGFCIPIFERKV